MVASRTTTPPALAGGVVFDVVFNLVFNLVLALP